MATPSHCCPKYFHLIKKILKAIKNKWFYSYFQINALSIFSLQAGYSTSKEKGN
jgi:hypothetical protein